MKTMYLTSLLLLVVACSGGQTTGGDTGGESQTQLKKAAAEAKANGTAQGDACAVHGWYGDGECDRFCQNVDSVDCTPSTGGGTGTGGGAGTGGGEVGCTLIREYSDGYCDPKRECPGQDPDCDVIHPTPAEPPTDPLICPAIALEANGKCDEDFNTDPCLFLADPDCAAVDPLPTEPPGGAGGTGGSTPSDPGSAGNSGGSPSVCAAYIEQSDGECRRQPTDPCIFQDPDCHVK